MGVDELTEGAGVHHTVVRQHLAKLEQAGLVERSPLAPSGRGRPKSVYRLTAEARRHVVGQDRYRRLAALLARAVRRGVEAREVGRLEGVEVAAASDDTDAVELLLAESERMGFEPSLQDVEGGCDVVLGHCPFQDVAAEDPETICGLHLGIAEGIAARKGDFEVEGMTVRDPVRAGCRIHVRPRGD